ncbi:sulfite exporter TauE/SafE family protein [candidate division KSB1 bacterium]|nr:sulfite exporter TauE/SafE family protein [candidate division KSB1 bacterium]
MPDPVLLSLLVLVVAALYSSVGHGGASGYLAVLALFSVAPAQMAGTALVLNIAVSALALFAFARSGHFNPRLTLPIIAVSVPLAFLGGLAQLPDPLYQRLLAFALVVAAIRIAMNVAAGDQAPTLRPVNLTVALPASAGIGLLSGMIGIGGGIFLSPLLILTRWATAKQSAATAAAFIFVNSNAGLVGRIVTHRLELMDSPWPIFAAVVGGIVGSRIGATQYSILTLRRVLAVVLLIAAAKAVQSSL